MRRYLSIILMSLAWVAAQAEEFSWEKIKLGLKNDLASYELIQPQLHEFYQGKLDELADYARQCNQLQLALYANKPNHIFYLTATLKEVEKVNKILEENSQPSNDMTESINMEQDRLQRLLVALLRQAEDERLQEELADSTILTQLDDSLLHSAALEEQNIQLQHNRDSCIMMVQQLISIYNSFYDKAADISAQYAELYREFTPVHEYMLTRQHDVRQRVFKQRDLPYLFILRNLPYFFADAINDSHDGEDDWQQMVSSGELLIIFGEMFGMLLLAILIGVLLHYAHRQFRLTSRFMSNPRIFINLTWVLLCLVCLLLDVFVLHLTALSQAANIFATYMAFVAILQISLLIREKGQPASAAMHLYAPSLFFGFCTIFIRLFMLPDSVLTLIVFPLSLGTFIWQLQAAKRYWGSASRFDSSLGGITVVIMLAMTILAAVGHVFLSMVLFLWWQAQEAALLIALALYDRLIHYEKHGLAERKAQYHEKAKSKETIRQQKGLLQVTWFFDLIKMVGVPFLAIASLPFCMFAALDYFNAGESYNTFFYNVFYSFVSDGDTLLQLSCYNFCRTAILFFIFRYVAYFLTTAYEQILVFVEVRRSGKEHIETNQVNLTMGVNIIKIVTWSAYLCACCIIFSIPTSALTFIFAGLATGIGFAMRDILNNVFYGMQLMAGRLRVGDYIICGPYRGSVTSISYQTTQMKTEENAMVYFSNADLFTKNFMNLTRENPYEVNRVYCNVAYGTDIALAERLIREAIEPFNEVDKFGRTRLSAKEGIRVEMTDLGDNGVQLAIRFGVIAELRTWFLPVLRKAIYEKLQEGGIKIPFPQMDLHIANPEQSQENTQPNETVTSAGK